MRNSTTKIISALACTLLVGTACDVPNAEEQAAVRVHVTGVDGQEVHPEQIDFVRYRLVNQNPQADTSDQQPATEAFCIDADCREWVLGAGEAGLFEIEASYCGRLQTTTVPVDSAEDSETIAAEEVTFAFNPALCQGTTDTNPLPKQGNEDPQGAELDTDETICDMRAHPSAYVYIARRFGDFLKVEPVDELQWRYVDDGEMTVETGDCRHPSEDGCGAWSVGWEQPGRIEVFTEWCGTEVSKTIFVPMTDDGCHVETQYVTLLVETTGCLSADTGEEPLPDDLIMMP